MQNGSYTRLQGGEGPASPTGVYARFFMEAVQDPRASAEQGRPIYREEERVEIIMPGNSLLAPVKRVTDIERQRFAREYEAFRKGVEAIPDGTPLDEWPILNRAQVAELRHLNFRTVEDIANAADTAISFMGGFGLREKARAYLDDAASVALQEKLSAENGQLRAEISNLQRQVQEQGELLAQVHRQMIDRENQPHPFLTTAPAQFDPLANLPAAETPAASSLAGFETARRRPGRPRKEEVAA